MPNDDDSLSRRDFTKLAVGTLAAGALAGPAGTAAGRPFGDDYPQLDSLATGEWWVKATKPKPKAKGPGQPPPPPMLVDRKDVIAFALYTHDGGVLKLTAQLYPLKPDEPRAVRLELRRGDAWVEVRSTEVVTPGWSAHFRVEDWDATQTVPYRVRHGDAAEFTGTIRRDPVEKPTIVVANMSCNSSRTTGARPEILEALLRHDPDLLFFGGDQTYRHTEHTAGWIEFGLQFRDVIRDRPTITIPDDHDVGHSNLWGESGKRSRSEDGADGGYFYPAGYVNMVQRQQTWHLPDPPDPAPIGQGITVYFTRLRVGGIDFAILEDRKFKTGPEGKIPSMGPRPDHINDPAYDPRAVDRPGLELLGERQHRFLDAWGRDWQGADVKAVFSQTAFCGAVHMHGKVNDRLLADLDCNGWPQTQRRHALDLIRRVKAVHLCGDQHLAVVVKHGLDAPGDGPYAFTSPALVNTIYGRWWHPADEKPGANPTEDSPLPWTGDYRDGLGNLIRMVAYANPEDITSERKRADGYGIVRFHKPTGQVTFECWPRFADPALSPTGQFPGWPVTIKNESNDGRTPLAFLPEIAVTGPANFVVELIDESTGTTVTCHRVRGPAIKLPVYTPGPHTIKLGHHRPDQLTLTGLNPGDQPRKVSMQADG